MKPVFGTMAVQLTLLCRWALLASLLLVAAESVAVFGLYLFADRPGTGAVTMLWGMASFFASAAVPLLLACLLAALLAAALSRFFSARMAGGLSAGLVTAGLVVVVGYSFATALYPDDTVIKSSRPLYVRLAALASGLILGSAAAWIAGRRIGRPFGRRSKILATAFVVLTIATAPIPCGIQYPMQTFSHPAEVRLRPPGTEAPLDGRPVVLVTVDTLRADHMSLYGYGRETTPRIDAWAKGATVFERAITPRTQTAPALASLLTSVCPDAHRLYRNGLRLDDSLVTIGERMKEAGYRTAAFAANYYVTSPKMGFRQGFDEWTGYDHDTGTAEKIVTDALEWMGRHRGERFFLWVHVIEPHTPYKPPARWREKFREDHLSRDLDGVEFEAVTGRSTTGQVNLKGVLGKDWEKLGLDPETLRDADYLVSLYDAEIACADEWVGRLLETLEEQVPDALVVLTSDHGESMTEHDYFFFHGRYCYEPGCRIPLVVRHPDRKEGMREGRLVSLVDVFPTLSDLTGITPPNVVEGRSFANVWHTDFRSVPLGRSRTVVDIEARSARTYRIRGVRGERWKLIMTPRRGTWPLDLLVGMQLGTRPGGNRLAPALLRRYRAELYDLDTDPGELENVADRHPEILGSLRRELMTSLQRQHLNRLALRIVGSTVEIDEAGLDELRALGYIK